MITSTWCVLTLFAARPEFQACQSIKSKNRETGVTGRCGQSLTIVSLCTSLIIRATSIVAILQVADGKDSGLSISSVRV